MVKFQNQSSPKAMLSFFPRVEGKNVRKAVRARSLPARIWRGPVRLEAVIRLKPLRLYVLEL